MRYVSTLGKSEPVNFAEAVLQGFAPDGGLFVPEHIPKISEDTLGQWSGLGYVELAEKILVHYIEDSLIPASDLRRLLEDSFADFEDEQIISMASVDDQKLWIMELFRGPTLSFKDVAMGFLLNVLDYFLAGREERLSLVLATTGDTGPAAAHAAAGKATIECWPLYPLAMISGEQERQMTTIASGNVHPVGVQNCRNGGDDLDLVVARLFADRGLKKRIKLSSVNSINWGRVLVQVIHYFFGYFRTVTNVGEKVVFSVPAGAFGNLCAGYIAREMGLPIEMFICATNQNKTLHTVFSEGRFVKNKLQQTLSSAIDIVIPYNFWRFVYFNSGSDCQLVNRLMADFEQEGLAVFDSRLLARLTNGFISTSVSDEQTLAAIRSIYQDSGYLLDPHGAVAVAGLWACRDKIDPGASQICLATAHPAKFPEVTRLALGKDMAVPPAGRHRCLDSAKLKMQRLRICPLESLQQELTAEMEMVMGEKRDGNVY